MVTLYIKPNNVVRGTTEIFYIPQQSLDLNLYCNHIWHNNATICFIWSSTLICPAAQPTALFHVSISVCYTQLLNVPRMQHKAVPSHTASEVSRSFEGTSNGGVGSSTSSKQKQSPEVKYNKMLQIPIETTGPPTKINKISTHRVVVSVLGGEGVIQKHRKGGKQWKRPMFWQTKQKSTVCCGAYQSQSGFAFLTALFCVARRFGVAFSPLPQCFPAPTMKVYEGGKPNLQM